MKPIPVAHRVHKCSNESLRSGVLGTDTRHERGAFTRGRWFAPERFPAPVLSGRPVRFEKFMHMYQQALRDHLPDADRDSVADKSSQYIETNPLTI